MIRSNFIQTAILLLTAAFAAGCNPKLLAPALEVPGRYRFGEGFVQDTTGIPEDWWRVFGDPTLDALVERALMENLDLAAAASRIMEARDNLVATRAEYLPAFALGRSAGASYSPSAKIEQSYVLTPTLSWEISLFGSLRHTKNAARAGIGYAEWQYRGVKLSLAAEVAATYFTLLQYKRDLRIAERSAQLRGESAALVDSMFRYGYVTGLDRERAMSLVYSAEADIPLYERSIQQTLLSLGVLLGQTPESLADIGDDASLVADYRPKEIPVGLPSDILIRRPDLMSAYWDMERAAAEVGIARSARLPAFTLTGAAGLASDDVLRMFSKKGLMWNVTLSFVEPLFNFGALKRKEQMARERYNQSMLSYEQTWLSALAEVEQALVSISTYREQTERFAEMVRSSVVIADMTHALYDSGLSAYLDVIDAERTLYESQMQYVNLLAQQYINYINLCKALGGGWEDDAAVK